MRDTAEGGHSGVPLGVIAPTGRGARRAASAPSRVEGGTLAESLKEWDELAIWGPLGWPLEGCRSRAKG